MGNIFSYKDDLSTSATPLSTSTVTRSPSQTPPKPEKTPEEQEELAEQKPKEEEVSEIQEHDWVIRLDKEGEPQIDDEINKPILCQVMKIHYDDKEPYYTLKKFLIP